MDILKNFVVFEGLDGSGTTTQLNTLEDFIHHVPVHKTYEPTDGIIGKMIRRCLGKEIKFTAETLAYLFAADRNEHIFGSGGVKERCERGEIVVSDRYLLSSLVYQGLSCGEELPARLNSSFPSPELLIYFDLDAETAQKRLSRRSQKEIFEYLDFQVKARELYKKILRDLSSQGIKIEIIDAALPPKEVTLKVRENLLNLPIFNR